MSEPRPRAEVRRAFAEVAPDLPLELVAEDVEARCVGMAFAAFTRTVDVDLAEELTAVPDREGAIRQHLEAWEALAPDQFAGSWREYTTDPYVGVGPGWVGVVNEETVTQWLASAELREALEALPPFSPRQVELSNLQVMTLGPARVLASYRVEETYRNGKTSAGNTFAVLMKIREQGWRIAVASKGTRHEAPLRE